jgi:hypothetical protein
VHPEGLDEPTVPALALGAEDGPRGRHLGPGHGVGNERHDVGEPTLAQVTVQSDDEVHVLGDAVRPVAADGEHVVALEEAERPRDDETAAEAVPAEPSEEKGAEVLDDLHAGKPAPVHACLGDASVSHRARVGDADGAADGGHGLAEQKGPRESEQRVRLDHRVGIDGEDVRESCGVQRGVERVRLAAILLVDHEELRVSP